MNKKSVEHYFETARQLPTAVSYTQIEQLVQIKGIVKPPSKPFWWNLNFYLMILTATIISVGLIINPFKADSKYQESTAIEAINLQTNESQRATQLALILEEPSSYFDSIAKSTNELVAMENSNYIEFNADSAFEVEQQIALPDTFIAEIAEMQAVIQEEFSEVPIDSVVKDKINFEADKELILEQDLKGVEWFDLQNSKADISIHSWNNSSIKLIAKVKIETHKDEDKAAAVEDFEMSLTQSGNRIGVESEWEDLLNCGCSIGKKKGQRRTKNGDKIKVSKLIVAYEVYLPNDIKLNLKNSYASMNIPDWNNDLKLRSFRGEVNLGNTNSEVVLSQSYGHAYLSNFKELELTAFRSSIHTKDGQLLKGKSNYSDLKSGQLEELKLATFKGDSYIKGVSKKADVSVKYGDMTIDGKTVDGKYTGFKAGINIAEVEQVDLNASYTRFNANYINELDISKAFQSKLNLGNVKQLQGELKYSPLEIKNLENSMSISTFRGKIDVEKVGKGFNLLKADSKYTDLTFNMDESAAYDMFVETQYAGMSLPEQNISLKFKEDNNTSSKVEAVINGGNEASKVEMNLFQGSLAFK